MEKQKTPGQLWCLLVPHVGSELSGRAVLGFSSAPPCTHTDTDNSHLGDPLHGQAQMGARVRMAISYSKPLST